MTQRLELPKGGFNFENYQRNVALEQQGLKLPTPTKTGTTVVGIIFKDGVVLGADTRSTAGSIVQDKNCDKIRYMAPNVYCCGAGTAADTQFTNSLICSQLELHRLATGRETRVCTALTLVKQMLFKYQGHVSAALILGGYDVTGPRLLAVAPHGSTDKLPYLVMGSGSYAAIAILENRWKKDLERQEAIDLVQEAIEAGIFNDLGSGSDVNITIIEKGKVDNIKGYARPNRREPKCRSYKFARGSTATLNLSAVTVTEGDAMDTS
ncbi:12770_t:CDS:2 [Ambispora gerdemannii]|uniref:Proteasome subunit beta n=1 Tax=Ambispora gerdemannii TaxID=144530 RepID=A0A9N8W754_9GLOM|nr:12770_t:CDS:2 [Ambispora gerdemannii]